MAYAPGPISIRPYYVAQQWGDYVLVADDVELGRAYSYVGLTLDAEANARLWAAAPDLLEACFAVEDAIRKGDLVWKHKRQADSDPYHPATTKLCAAIAKATRSETE